MREARGETQARGAAGAPDATPLDFERRERRRRARARGDLRRHRRGPGAAGSRRTATTPRRCSASSGRWSRPGAACSRSAAASAICSPARRPPRARRPRHLAAHDRDRRGSATRSSTSASPTSSATRSPRALRRHRPQRRRRPPRRRRARASSACGTLPRARGAAHRHLLQLRLGAGAQARRAARRCKTPWPAQNWLSMNDIDNLLHLSGFEVVRRGTDILLPVDVPCCPTVANRVGAKLPVLREGVARRLLRRARRRRSTRWSRSPSVSVVCPCRNEQGNIREAVARTPLHGPRDGARSSSTATRRTGPSRRSRP